VIFPLGAYVSDDVRLNRLVPYTVALLPDVVANLAGGEKENANIVRASALHTLTRLLSMVRNVGAEDAQVFSVRRALSFVSIGLSCVACANCCRSLTFAAPPGVYFSRVIAFSERFRGVGQVRGFRHSFALALRVLVAG